MVANQTEFSAIEQRSVIKVLVAVMSKPSEIYKKMCDVYGEACLNNTG